MATIDKKQPQNAHRYASMDLLCWLQTGKPCWLFNIFHVRDGHTARIVAVGTDGHR